MEIVEGEAISPEEANGPGWITAYNRKPSKSKANQSQDARPTSTRGRRRDSGRTAEPRSAYQRLVATSRLPQLPRDTYRIIVRPRDGLNVAKITPVQFEQALAMAAALAPQDLMEDSICPNVTQNIFVVCTPIERNARAYTMVQQLRLRDTLYRVAVYPAPPDNTCKGVIRGIDIDLTDTQLRELIVTKRNPSALEVKRIKNTTAVTILFQGMQVPNYVYCGASIVRCTLFRRHTEVCYNCGSLGHRADVCPNPNTTWCRKCGLKTPPENHQCKPHCTLCGGPHPTADKDCKRKFQVPYIVRQRRRRRRRRGRSRSRGSSGASSRDSSATSSTYATSRRSCSLTPTARRRSAQRSHSRSRRHSPPRQAELTWADRVQGKKPPLRSTPPVTKVTRPSLPEHESEVVTTLREELAGLRATIQQLTTQLNEARHQIQTLTAPKDPPSSTVDVSKPKRRAPPLREADTNDSDSPEDTLNEILRLTRENHDNIDTLSRRVEALEQKATIKAKTKARTVVSVDPTANLPGPPNSM
ncbi:uncharacterized protein LOC142775837 isoform X1 [Rhipicephalus microplus]|uniref:uncharacterized protein LOC142775837 isoform X1 n=1 Tax=Rhipicephalus microplus TaxID=6941 RepID=UPI003F6BCEEC